MAARTSIFLDGLNNVERIILATLQEVNMRMNKDDSLEFLLGVQAGTGKFRQGWVYELDSFFAKNPDATFKEVYQHFLDEACKKS